MLGPRHRMRGEPDVIGTVGARHCRAPRRASPKTATARRNDGPDREERIVSIQQYSSVFAENKGIRPHRRGYAGAKTTSFAGKWSARGGRAAFQLPERSMTIA